MLIARAVNARRDRIQSERRIINRAVENRQRRRRLRREIENPLIIAVVEPKFLTHDPFVESNDRIVGTQILRARREQIDVHFRVKRHQRR